MNDYDDTPYDKQMWEDWLEQEYPDPEEREQFKSSSKNYAFHLVFGSAEELAEAESEHFKLLSSLNRTKKE